MGNNLLFLAGENAYSQIMENGLSPEDVKVCVSASGAAKWLSIYGLDRAVFGDWLIKTKKPVHFFGTSIGAWKFAAACQKDCKKSFDLLADLYINQRYGRKTTPDEVSKTAEYIVDSFLDDVKIDEILTHPVFRISFSAVRCLGNTARKELVYQSGALLKAAISNLVKRENIGRYFERTFFYDKRTSPPFLSVNSFPLNKVSLDKKNFKKALLASGSIPVVMNGIEDIEGAPEGVYRDGGIIDYHPVFDFTGGVNDGKIVLYHHFYNEIIPGWFDKKLFWRRAGKEDLKNVLLLAPSPEFVSGLPYKRIPDRKDFNRFYGKDDERIQFWEKAKEKSHELGQEFLEAVEGKKIKNIIKKI
ncbi:MAG: patatin-like phospholipase family protein [Desulfobacteraceae bacterium]|nr:patatin-like phospholipase family protein [Desulfobacteraceae bacterium]MCB9494714.1 patatin-like phospholipase family protein [Desulfobacteraceae bacterium]